MITPKAVEQNRNTSEAAEAIAASVTDEVKTAEAEVTGAVKRTRTAAKRTSSGLKIEKDREERNGIKRPSVGGTCRAVWDALDAAVAEGKTPSAKDVKAMAEAKGWNPNNASIEFYQWRKFHGITGRQ